MAGKVSIMTRGVVVLVEWKSIRPARSSAVLKVAENKMATIYEESFPAPCILFPATWTEEVADLDLDFSQQKHAGITWTCESSGKQQRHNLGQQR